MATDPRLAALYDTDNPAGEDHRYFRRVADQLRAERIIDLGCGTGLLTVTLARAGRSVVGIDPDRGMLQVAMDREGGRAVEWRLGDARSIDARSSDLVLMTGNVAQHIGPSAWIPSLRHISDGLRPGGVLCFETRNPAMGAWRRWRPEQTRRTRETPSGRLTQWMDTTEPDRDGTVILNSYNEWESGERLVVPQPLTFRTHDTIDADLRSVGLTIRTTFGDWSDSPLGETSELFVVEAIKTS